MGLVSVWAWLGESGWKLHLLPAIFKVVNIDHHNISVPGVNSYRFMFCSKISDISEEYKRNLNSYVAGDLIAPNVIFEVLFSQTFCCLKTKTSSKLYCNQLKH